MAKTRERARRMHSNSWSLAHSNIWWQYSFSSVTKYITSSGWILSQTAKPRWLPLFSQFWSGLALVLCQEQVWPDMCGLPQRISGSGVKYYNVKCTSNIPKNCVRQNQITKILTQRTTAQNTYRKPDKRISRNRARVIQGRSSRGSWK